MFSPPKSRTHTSYEYISGSRPTVLSVSFAVHATSLWNPSPHPTAPSPPLPRFPSLHLASSPVHSKLLYPAVPRRHKKTNNSVCLNYYLPAVVFEITNSTPLTPRHRHEAESASSPSQRSQGQARGSRDSGVRTPAHLRIPIRYVHHADGPSLHRRKRCRQFSLFRGKRIGERPSRNSWDSPVGENALVVAHWFV